MAKLLIVEDNLYNLELAAQYLRAEGYEVDQANDLRGAYDHLDQNRQKAYDAIVSDYNLGHRKETGLQVYQFALATYGSLAMPPLIGTSSEIEKWQEIIDVFLTDEGFARNPTIHAIPKHDGGTWNIGTIVTKLKELNINP